jgi:hypothetical protein
MNRKHCLVPPSRIGRWPWAAFLVVALAVGSIRARCDDEPVSYSLQPTRPQISANLPANLVGYLQPSGYRVFGQSEGEKYLICEIFWAKTIRTTASESPAGSIPYSKLKQGSLIGVIHFLIVQRYVRDYRSQTLRPGYYTMRYAVMPKGSDDKEPRDFVLLTPVNADKSPAVTLALPELVHRSRLASPIKRPVALSLVAIDPDEKLPSLVSDEEGTSVLQVKLRAASAAGKPPQDVPVALVVITSIPEDLGD